MRLKKKINRFRYLLWLLSKGLYKSDRVFTHLTSLEKRQLFLIASELPAGAKCVEIGSYLGASSSFIARALPKQSSLYCVDTWNNDAMTEGNRNTREEFLYNTSQFKDKIVPIQSRSTDAAKDFSEPLDFIFFDGDHSYEGIKDDWDAWNDKLKSGGWVIFHDIGWAEGVKRVIVEEVTPRILESDALPNMFWAKLK